MNHEENDKTTGILVSLLIGGIVGAGLALLFAPRSGQATRKKLLKLADDAKESAADYAGRLKDKIS